MNTELTHLLNSLVAEEQKANLAISAAQAKLEAVRSKRIAVETTLALLSNSPGELPLPIGAKYANVGLTEAVLDCVNEGPAEGLTRAEIAKLVASNGFVYNGKKQNFYPAVSMALSRMAGKKIAAKKIGGSVRFSRFTQQISHVV